MDSGTNLVNVSHINFVSSSGWSVYHSCSHRWYGTVALQWSEAGETYGKWLRNALLMPARVCAHAFRDDIGGHVLKTSLERDLWPDKGDIESFSLPLFYLISFAGVSFFPFGLWEWPNFHFSHDVAFLTLFMCRIEATSRGKFFVPSY